MAAPSAVIVDAVRTPMGKGKPGGALSSVNPVDLLAQLLRALFDRNDVDPGQVDDVVTGCVSQAGEQAGTPGRFAWLAAGLPEHVPGVTIDRRCGSGQQDAELVPIEAGDGTLVTIDETIRPDTSEAKLATLRPSFRDDSYADRFPEIEWSITAGNSSQLTDGAAALLIMSEHRAARLGLQPLARLVSFATHAEDPVTMLTAPIPASHKVLTRAGMGIDDIARYEVNEAFASVPLAWQHELGADPDKLNPAGGAIALGHPLGASGARIMTTLVHGLKPGEYGLQTMCENGEWRMRRCSNDSEGNAC